MIQAGQTGNSAARAAPGTHHLSMAEDQLGPAFPLRTLVPVGEGGVGFPAAVLVVEPEPCQTHSFLQICHPVGRDVDQTCQGTWFKRKKKKVK